MCVVTGSKPPEGVLTMYRAEHVYELNTAMFYLLRLLDDTRSIMTCFIYIPLLTLRPRHAVR